MCRVRSFFFVVCSLCGGVSLCTFFSVYVLRGYRGCINESIRKKNNYISRFSPKNLGYEPEIHISLFGCTLPDTNLKSRAVVLRAIHISLLVTHAGKRARSGRLEAATCMDNWTWTSRFFVEVFPSYFHRKTKTVKTPKYARRESDGQLRRPWCPITQWR